MLARSLLSSLFIAALLLTLTPITVSGQIYVDKDSPSGGDGTTWSQAYNTLKAGLANADSGDQVWVADGTYHPDQGPGATADSRDATFSLPDGVTVIGGFEGYGEAEEQSLPARPPRFDQATTNLSGEIQQDGDASNNAYHVVTSRGADSNPQLRNVRITQGNANGRGENSLGGGILLDNTDADIVNAYVQQNKAKRGAGIGVKGGSATLHGLLVNANTATEAGGGIYNYDDASTIAYTTIADNDAPSGAGVFKAGSNADWPNTVSTQNNGANIASESLGLKTIDLTTTTVGNDLYQDGDSDGLGYDDISFHPENGTLDEIVITAGPVQKTVDVSGGTGTVSVPTTSDIDNVTFEQADPDYIQTWMMNDTETEAAPDLRRDFQGSTGFEPVPTHMSNYDDGANEDADASDYNRIPIQPGNLKASYEARVIPARTPRPKDSRVDGSRDTGWETYDSTIDEWLRHIATGGRWKTRTVDGNTRDQVKTYIVDGNSTYESNANYAWDRLRDILPYPTSAPQSRQSSPDILARFDHESV